MITTTSTTTGLGTIGSVNADVDYATNRYLEMLDQLRERNGATEQELIVVLNQRVGSDIGDAYFEWCEEGANDVDLPPDAA